MEKFREQLQNRPVSNWLSADKTRKRSIDQKPSKYMNLWNEVNREFENRDLIANDYDSHSHSKNEKKKKSVRSLNLTIRGHLREQTIAHRACTVPFIHGVFEENDFCR